VGVPQELSLGIEVIRRAIPTRTGGDGLRESVRANRGL
jgi:hypothetical protein